VRWPTSPDSELNSAPSKVDFSRPSEVKHSLAHLCASNTAPSAVFQVKDSNFNSNEQQILYIAGRIEVAHGPGLPIGLRMWYCSTQRLPKSTKNIIRLRGVTNRAWDVPTGVVRFRTEPKTPQGDAPYLYVQQVTPHNSLQPALHFRTQVSCRSYESQNGCMSSGSLRYPSAIARNGRDQQQNN